MGVFSLRILTKDLFLPFGQFFGNLDQHLHQLMAGRAAAEAGEADVFERYDFAVLGTGRDAKIGFSEEGGCFDIRPERGLGERDRHLHDEVVFVAHEERMLFDADIDVEVATGAALVAGFALGTDADGLAVMNAGGDFHGDFAFFGGLAGAIAIGAWGFNGTALAEAMGASRNHLKHAAEAALRDLAAATTGATGDTLGAGFGAISTAGFTGILAGEIDFAFAPFGDILQRDLHLCFKIVATRCATATGALTTATEGIAAKEGGEKVLNVGRVHVGVIVHGRAAKTVVAMLIVA